VNIVYKKIFAVNNKARVTMKNIILYYKPDDLLKLIEGDIAIEQLYFQEAYMPTEKIIIEHIKNKKIKDKEIITFFENNITKGIKRNKINLSKIDNKIPLYDVYTENMYIVSKNLVYDRIIYNSYRFPDSYLVKKLIRKRKENIISENKDIIMMASNDPDKYHKEYNHLKTEILAYRKYNKLVLMTQFIKSYHIPTLFNTFVKVIYLYANKIGKNITSCKRPSFLSHFYHIKPYYSRSELINLALNMKLIDSSNKYYDINMVEKLCDKIVKNDINASILLDHQQHIAKQNKIGLVQYYSLQGSYFVNQYLRNQTNHRYVNEHLETIISEMWKLVITAPAFDKEYILYRFMNSDTHLRNIDIGDIYCEEGFMSTTRDPFYRSDLYKFGFILVKIKIPANMQGSALCIETYSHFSNEQEILLPPLSLLRLEAKNNDCSYYHTDSNFLINVKTKYEFVFVGKKEINFTNLDRIPVPTKPKTIDFLKLEKPKTIDLTLESTIAYFVKNNLNELYQYKINVPNQSDLSNQDLTVFCEWYDSTGAYEPYYSLKSNNGFSMYVIKDNYVLFVAEVGMLEGKLTLALNYYVRYSVIDRRNIIDDKYFINFVSGIANYFSIPNVIIYADFMSCDNKNNSKKIVNGQRSFENKNNSDNKKNLDNLDNLDDDLLILGGNYCVDIYEYLKIGTKRFETLKLSSIELISGFSYERLDMLKNIDPYKILNKEDPDELYQIYDKTYKTFVTPDKRNIADFFIWSIENQCYLVNILVSKIENLYMVDNPFKTVFYLLEPFTYLYNNNLISAYPFRTINREIIKDAKIYGQIDFPKIKDIRGGIFSKQLQR
jgi:hypothetical protein